MAEKKRHLPVLKSPEGAEEPAEERPPWHWIGFGTVAIFAAWIPLVLLAQNISQRLIFSQFPSAASLEDISRSLANATSGDRAVFGLKLALPHAFALALAAYAGGFAIGKFGKKTSPREGALAGVAVLLIVGGLVVGQVGFIGFLPPLLAIPFAALGVRSGARYATAA